MKQSKSYLNTTSTKTKELNMKRNWINATIVAMCGFIVLHIYQLIL